MREVAQISARAFTTPKDSAQAQSPDGEHALHPVVGQMLRLQKTIGNLAIQRLLKSAAPRTELAIGRRVGGPKLPRALEVRRTARRDAAEQAHCGSESLLQRSEGEGGSPRVRAAVSLSLSLRGGLNRPSAMSSSPSYCMAPRGLVGLQ